MVVQAWTNPKIIIRGKNWGLYETQRIRPLRKDGGMGRGFEPKTTARKEGQKSANA